MADPKGHFQLSILSELGFGMEDKFHTNTLVIFIEKEIATKK